VCMVWGKWSKVEGRRLRAHGKRLWCKVDGGRLKADRARRIVQVGCYRAWGMGHGVWGIVHAAWGLGGGIRTTPRASLREPQDQTTGS
jgi:hypothetical protein